MTDEPSPYYTDGRVTIYHGDCRELLPTLTADVILTDLPYGIGVDYDVYDDSTHELAATIRDTLPLMRRSAPVVALTCGIGNWWRFPEPTWVLCWQQLNSGTGTGRWGFNLWQPVLVYGTDPYLKRGLGRRPDVVGTGASSADLIATRTSKHPCPKPLAPWRAILNRVSPEESDTIFDPFMGSGTTVVAAKYSGRRAIGIDISERYCEIAATRLAQGVLDLEMAGDVT